jgi:hypothetical protein
VTFLAADHRRPGSVPGYIEPRAARRSQDQPGGPTVWAPAAYSALLNLLSNPIYGGAYAFGITKTKTRVIEGRARKIVGHKKPRSEWTVPR